MITGSISTKNLINFINKQPKERRINFSISYCHSRNECSCLMVQYAQDVLLENEQFLSIECSYECIYIRISHTEERVYRLQEPILTLLSVDSIHRLSSKCKTYGELQAHMHLLQ